MNGDGSDDWQTRVRETIKRVADRLLEGGASAQSSTRVRRAVVAVCILIIAFSIVLWSVQTRGILNTIWYTFVFLSAAAFFPIIIGLFGHLVFNSVGKLHLILGAVAFNHHYLVQRRNRWEWCPGDRGRVYIDDEWHDITSGLDNYNVLSWRPFGILRYKDADTWTDRRADTAAQRDSHERDPTADGGQATVEYAGIEEVSQPAISGKEGTWLLDLKRICTRGVRKIGDVELIETAEEVIERGQVDDGKLTQWGPLAETLGGLILGICVGFGYILIA